MTGPTQIFDRQLLAQRRRRVAAHAAQHDFLLRRVADDFAERLAIVRRDFSFALNLGAYHGVLTPCLASLASVTRVIEAELAADAVSGAGGCRVAADEEALPFAPQSLDIIVSGLSLHLVNDLPGALVQVRQALRGDGLFLAAMLGGDTLKELREAWLVAEDEIAGGASARVAPFADVRSLGGLLQRAGFALPVVDSDSVRVTYESPLHLMREVKGMGASNALTLRRRVPVTRTLLMRAAQIYVERFGLADGRVPATFEIITMTAWAPHESQPKPLRPGSAQVSLADVLKPGSSRD